MSAIRSITARTCSKPAPSRAGPVVAAVLQLTEAAARPSRLWRNSIARSPGALLAALTLCGFVLLAPGHGRADDAEVETAWCLLDYVAIDYGGAVADGRVVSEAEYAEMVEFAGAARDRIAALPAHAARDRLVQEAERLRTTIGAKAPQAVVAGLARGLGDALLAAYSVPLAPKAVPDPAKGAVLYARDCAACHGASGRGDGSAAAGLDPAPVAFTDRERARERSVFALYQVIGSGVEGTSMPAFAQLPAEDRWSLAFQAARFAFTDAEAREGERLWRNAPDLRRQVPNLEALVRLTPTALADRVGDAEAWAVMAHLRRQPGVLASRAAGSLALARTKLADAVRAYEAGDRRTATDLALSAYLDGVEPIEPLLGARDSTLLAQVEAAMGELRARIGRGGAVDEVRSQALVIGGLFDRTEHALAPDRASAASSLVGAFTILLREGLEALLLVVAMIGFLRKADRADALPFVHAGWVAALAAGLLTWGAATYAIEVSGASRELTEGFGSLLAALVLLSVGLWMHGKSHADAWRRCVREKMSRALSRRSAWFVFLLSFVVVYREAFETILFYAALWSQGNGAAVLAGTGLALATLAAIAWAMLRFGRRLPIERFFAYTSMLMAALAVVMVGKGIAALQEVGLVAAWLLPAVPRVDLFGLHPTVQGTLGQAAMLAAVVAGFQYSRRAAAHLGSRGKSG